MFVIINISFNLLQTLSSFLINNSKRYVIKKNAKKSSCRKYHNATSLKIEVIEKYYYIRKKNLTENNNSNNN